MGPVWSSSGEQPLVKAAKENNLAEVKRLLGFPPPSSLFSSTNINNNEPNSLDSTSSVTVTTLSADCDPSLRDAEGWSAIEWAVAKGNLEIVKLLHAYGSKLDELNSFGNGLAHYAAMNSHLEILDFLEKEGFSPLFVLGGRDKDTPAHLAARWGAVNSIRWFAARKNSVELLLAKGYNDMTPNQIAVNSRNVEMIEFLKSWGQKHGIKFAASGEVLVGGKESSDSPCTTSPPRVLPNQQENKEEVIESLKLEIDSLREVVKRQDAQIKNMESKFEKELEKLRLEFVQTN